VLFLNEIQLIYEYKNLIIKQIFEGIKLEEMWGYATILFVTPCNYVSFVTTFATTYQLYQIWGGFATILWLMCNYYLFIMILCECFKIIFLNKPPWPISCIYNQNLVTNWCTLCIMGMISIHIWGSTIKKSTYTIINICYEYYQHICRV
jgi:surface polysaccharide O-acyltransferase-like enzyme